MPLIAYKEMRWGTKQLDLLHKAEQLIRSYAAQGYSLTLRQIYYQFVARDWFPESWIDPKTGSANNMRSYQKLGNIIANARLCGKIDWNAIHDITRNLSGNNHWASPAGIIQSSAEEYARDKWETQEHRVEVWIEKDAIKNIAGKAAHELDIDYLSCRGFTSLSAMWIAARRLYRYALAGQQPVVLHLGDFDPSGVDMSRDIEDRLRMFMEETGDFLIFRRVALNMEQIREYDPPANPAKQTDSRFKEFSRLHGDESWELDALDPLVIDGVIRKHVAEFRDDERFQEIADAEAIEREELTAAGENWRRVAKFIHRQILKDE